MKKKLLIGFGSKARIGKDFAVTELRALGYSISRVAFADVLKSNLASFFHLYHKMDFYKLCEDDTTKAKLRPLMVAYGQVMRELDPYIWVDSAGLPSIIDTCDSDIVAVTDVRFPNEVARLKQLGGVYIDIDADVPPANETEAENSALLRDMADYVVRNDFDSNYRLALDKLIKELKAR